MSGVTVKQLIQKLRSPDSKLVVQAVEELRAREWLSGGALEGADLRYAHLQGVDLHRAGLRRVDLCMADLQRVDLSMADLQRARLRGANLPHADLSRANLRGADLSQANLRGARNLTEEQLTRASRLQGATLPDGSLYNGRFNLAGDLAFARVGSIDTSDPDAMAEFYGMPGDCNCDEDEIGLPPGTETEMQLIRKLRSPDNKVVRQAVEGLRVRGCLCDGSLEWVRLRYVHLQGADLCEADLNRADLCMADLRYADLSRADLRYTRLNRADLRGANLSMTDLREASLTRANLYGARNLTDEQLARASRLRGSTLPDGSLYDGRFNLAGDLGDAHFLGLDTSDAQAMANFYGVAVGEYRHGQAWAKGFLPGIWGKTGVEGRVYTEFVLSNSIELARN
jgi:uncharacterized protein YjbI with pentapeptide repeats